MIKLARTTGLEKLELERLRDRVGRLFAALQEATLTEGPVSPGAWSPPVDVCESKDAITVRAELPGVDAERIKVGLTTANLRIYGEKKKPVPPSRTRSHLCSERTYGQFNRVVPLRWAVCVRESEAELVNGVLIVRLPKLKDRRGSEFKVLVKEKKN